MISRCDLLQQIGVRYRVFDVIREVLHLFRLTGACQVIVDPTQEKLFFGELEQVLFALAVVEQEHETRVMCQVNIGKQTDLIVTQNKKYYII